MTRIVTQLRHRSPEEKQEWHWAAGQSGETLTSWLQRLANEEVDRLRAELGERTQRERERQLLLDSTFPGRVYYKPAQSDAPVAPHGDDAIGS